MNEKYKAIYTDIWNFHKKYADLISKDDGFWESVIQDADEICKKHGNCLFVRGLICTVTEEFERIIKSQA